MKEINLQDAIQDAPLILRGLPDYEYYWRRRVLADTIINSILIGKWKQTNKSLNSILEIGERNAHGAGLILPNRPFNISVIKWAKEIRTAIRNPDTKYEPWVPFQFKLAKLTQLRWKQV